MADDDFDTAGLAAYLHLQPAQVGKLADRGKLPGARSGASGDFLQAKSTTGSRRGSVSPTKRRCCKWKAALGKPPGAAELAEISFDELLPVEAIEVPLAVPARATP